ncbi:MAG: ferredoxin [Actinomycetota bacterium]
MTGPNEDSGGTVRVTVDQGTCIAGGQCEMLEPDTFLIDDDTAVAGIEGDGWLPRDRAEIVIERCPGRAISIIEE